MRKQTQKAAKATQYDNPGRPKYIPMFPRSKEWTFTQFMEVNGINTNPNSKEFGKGPHCTMLTLRKFMARDAARKAKSWIFRQKGVTSEPNSNDGLGRRAYLYSVRANANIPTPTIRGGTSAPATPVARKTRKAKTAPAVTSTGVSESTQKYEELKAILSAPSPAPAAPAAVTVPAVTIAPEPAPVAPAPAVEAPKEEAPAVTAPEAAPVAA